MGQCPTLEGMFFFQSAAKLCSNKHANTVSYTSDGVADSHMWCLNLDLELKVDGNIETFELYCC